MIRISKSIYRKESAHTQQFWRFSRANSIHSTILSKTTHSTLLMPCRYTALSRQLQATWQSSAADLRSAPWCRSSSGTLPSHDRAPVLSARRIRLSTIRPPSPKCCVRCSVVLQLFWSDAWWWRSRQTVLSKHNSLWPHWDNIIFAIYISRAAPKNT